ncbi:MAG: ABC transporter permease [Vulcanimicrobiaceae bacterium]
MRRRPLDSTVLAVALPTALLLAFILAPLAALVLRTSPAAFFAALQRSDVLTALRLSCVTTLVTLLCAIALGTPAAYLLARFSFPGRRVVDALVDLPIVVPPAVAGVALLIAFGRRGLFAPLLDTFGIQLSFTTAAVVLAQLFVSSPFYVRSARAGFLAVDRRLEEASATLGSSRLATFWRVTIPLALPSLIGGAVLTWARALGEFGATIMFAGNLMGVSQTMPLAVYLNLESGDLSTALALSLILVTASLAVLLVVRLAER